MEFRWISVLCPVRSLHSWALQFLCRIFCTSSILYCHIRGESFQFRNTGSVSFYHHFAFFLLSIWRFVYINISTYILKKGDILQAMKTSRPAYDEYFMRIAKIVATRSTCLRRHVGAVIVRNNHILSTGYNGPPKGFKHCDETGCMREKLDIPRGERHELCRGLHAEQNAIIQAAVFGVSIKGGTIYVTHFPCSVCAKMLVNAELKEIVYKIMYPDELSLEILKESNLNVRQLRVPQ